MPAVSLDSIVIENRGNVSSYTCELLVDGAVVKSQTLSGENNLYFEVYAPGEAMVPGTIDIARVVEW